MRLRLSSLEPDHIDDLLLEQLRDPRMQPYFHIPIQSAADKVIRRINRTYDSAHLEYVIGQLRLIKDDPFLACDIITGLPGEGPDEFEITRSFLERHGFALMHVFPFSPRPDTALADARDRAPESVRDERALILRNLSAQLNRTYVERQVGREAEVILEGRRIGKWHGITGNYLKVDVSGAPDSASVGDLFKVRITSPTKAEVIP
jgi:threonylcarbamoyladenosine tRNA methylthiotransferase MtaB